MIGLGVLFVVCVFFSAFFSGSEMSFVSSDRIKMRKRADSGMGPAQKVLRFYEETEKFLTTILIGNNIVNVGATVICTYFLSENFGIENEWLVTLIMTPLILILGEIIPKDYCRHHADDFMIASSNALSLIFAVFSHISSVILKSVNLLLVPFGFSSHKGIFVNEEEFRYLIVEGTKSGAVGHHEKKIIDTILDFEKIKVESVMIPLENVPKVSLTEKTEHVRDVASQTGSDMCLVYEEIPSIIVGMIYVFDLLFEERKNIKLQPFLRSPIFIPKETSIEKAFFTLQQKRQSYAVVIDENSEVAGVVHIEKLITLG